MFDMFSYYNDLLSLTVLTATVKDTGETYLIGIYPDPQQARDTSRAIKDKWKKVDMNILTVKCGMTYELVKDDPHSMYLKNDLYISGGRKHRK